MTRKLRIHSASDLFSTIKKIVAPRDPNRARSVNLRMTILLAVVTLVSVATLAATMAGLAASTAENSATPTASATSATAPVVPLAPQGLPNCTPPGVEVVTDPAGDQNPAGTAQMDIVKVSFAEPDQDDGGERLVVTMKMTDLNASSLPVNATWTTFFNVGTTTYFVAATTTDPTAPGGVSYEYGFVDPTTGIVTTQGSADVGQLDDANNSFIVTISNSLVGSPVAGTTLTGVFGRSQLLVGVLGTGFLLTIDTAPNNAAAGGRTYTLVGNAACGSGTPTPTPTPTVSPTPSPTPDGGPCIPPGVQVVTDPANDNAAPGQGDQDILAVSFAEPAQVDGSDRLYITMTVRGPLDPDNLPLNGRWRTHFKHGATTWFVTVSTSDPTAPGPPAGVAYEYGQIDPLTGSNSTLGNADGGSVNADGTLTVIVSNNLVGSPVAGNTLTEIRGTTSLLVGAAGTGSNITIDRGPNGTAFGNPYTLVGNEFCEDDPTPTPTPTPSPSGSPTPSPTPTPQVGPRYLVYQPPAGMGTGAAEPSVGVNHDTGKVMYIAGLETLQVDFDNCTQGATWRDVSFITTSQRTLDPILFTDNINSTVHPDRTFVSQLAGKTSLMAYTDNDGGTDGTAVGDWTQSQGSGINSGVDHQSIGGGPFHDPLTRDPNGPLYPHAIYYCSQDVADAYCALSADGGQTFGPAVPIYTVAQCGGLHGSPQVGPDGTVYVPNKGCGGNQAVVVSENNGASWTIRPVLTSTPGRWDPFVGISKNGVLYFGYGAQNGRPRVAVSHNRGITWTDDKVVGLNFGANGIRDTAFPSVVAGDDDRAAFAFLGTPNPGANAVWSLYIAHTYDSGLTWTTVNATGADPVQRGTICSGGTLGCPNGDRNLLDFNDVTKDPEGRVVAAIADGCIGPCIQGGQNSFTALATIARQSGGKRLFAEFDPPDPSVPSSPVLTEARRDSFGVHLKWNEPDSGGTPITEYRVYRKADGGMPPPVEELIATLAAGDRDYLDRDVDPGVTYRYRVKAVNSIGESSDCAPLVLPVVAPPANPCVSPGMEVLNDPVGDAVPPLPSADITSLSVAELFDPANPSANKLTFTLKMAGGGPLPPNAQWYIIWKRQNVGANDREYVAMKTNFPGTSLAPAFVYGEISAPSVNAPTDVGSADSGSYDSATGTITITISNSKVENVSPGQTLSNLEVRVFNRGDATGLLPVTQAGAQDFTSFGQQYVVVGNFFCRENNSPTASLTAMPTAGGSPLTVNFSGAASSDSDAGDTIASYEMNFGDGSPVVEQALPTFSHVYTEPGVHRATLTVTDSRGLESLNVADAFITVDDPGCKTNYAAALAGASAVGSTTYFSRNYVPQGAIDGDILGRGWEQGGGWNDATRGVWPDWLQIDFNGEKEINEIRVYTLQNDFRNPVPPTETTLADLYGLIDFNIEYWDGGQWVTVGGPGGVGEIRNNDKAMRTINFPPLATTKIRIFVLNGRVHFSRIVEVEALGCSTP